MVESGKYHILIVENDALVANQVRGILEKEGYRVSIAKNGPDGEKTFFNQEPHLLIIDFNLSIFDGIELSRRIRKTSTVPILILKSLELDTAKPIGLGIGADDCITKPIDSEQLVARVKALLRRGYQYNEVALPTILGGPRLKVDVDRHQVTLDGTSVHLTNMEFNLLKELVANPGWVFDRPHLLKKVWGYSDAEGEKSVTMHISNLRNKLNCEGVEFIRTVYGKGYTYTED